MSLLDGMKLPKSSIKEELEQLSKDKLRPLFENSLFEFREETYRDKGIDIIFELKYKGVYTNFRFIVQLKSTNSKKPKSDGAYSWQIDTSNIQYLLNAGIPAYYICYVKGLDTFYFKQLNSFVAEIYSKTADWNKQDSHALKTIDVLNEKSIMQMYNDVRVRCESSRKLNETLHIINTEVVNKKVSIYSDYKITDESAIVDLIERNGFDLINKGQFRDLILLTDKVSNDIVSPRFNLIAGITHFYTSHLFDALAYFKKAQREKEKLSIELQEHLSYFHANAKYSIGYINQEEYFNVLKELESSQNLSGYVKIEEAKNIYEDTLTQESSFDLFKQRIFSIINDEKSSTNIRLIAKSEYLLYWGSKINMDHIRQVAMINFLESQTGPNLSLRGKLARQLEKENKEWEAFYDDLDKEIMEAKNFFALNMCKLNEIKVRFETIVQNSIISFEAIIPDYPAWSDYDHSNSINTILINLDKIANNYRNKYYVENLLATLSTKYEVLMFIKKHSDAEKVAAEIYQLIEFHDLKEAKRKFDFLRNDGTMENALLNMLSDTVGKAKKDRNEYDLLIDEMVELDELESKIENDQNDHERVVIVELFPMKHFLIPKQRLDEFYELLHVNNYQLIKQLNMFFDNNIIPVLNIFNEIEREGYLNGMADDKGIESWRKIRDIRVKLFNQKFRRVLM
ncbi:MAG: DUF4365 domain-containing protein [Paludibacter sp.]|nr:DUF4365 domain-containing protein [Paludibacter sp.]